MGSAHTRSSPERQGRRRDAAPTKEALSVSQSKGCFALPNGSKALDFAPAPGKAVGFFMNFGIIPTFRIYATISQYLV